MKHLITCSAAALLAAPVCIVAQARTIEENMEETLALINELSDILENVTPQSADACLAELEQLESRILALKNEADTYTDEEKKAILQNPEIVSKLQAPTERLMKAIIMLHIAAGQNPEPQQQAELKKIIDKLESFKL